MCKRAIEKEPETLEYVPDHLKTQETCERKVEEEPYTVVPDYFKMKKICGGVVKNTHAHSNVFQTGLLHKNG